MKKDHARTSLLELTICKCNRSAHAKAEEATCISARQTEACLCMKDETCQNSTLVENSGDDEDSD